VAEETSFWQADRTLRVLTWVAGAAVGVFLIWLAIRRHEVIHAIYSNSDNAGTPVIAEFFGERGAGNVTLGNYPWLESLYAELATKWLPSHRVVWELEPFLVLGASIALVGWTIRRTVSRWAGLLVGLAMASPAPLAIWVLGAPALRLNTFAHCVLLAAFLVLAPGLREWTRTRRAVWAVALAVTLAPGVASDPILMTVSGTVPLLAAVALAWRLEILERAGALLAGAAAVAGSLAGLGLEKLAEHDGITYRAHDFPLSDSKELFSNIRLLLEDVANFAHGVLGGPPHAVNALEEAIALAAMIGVPALCVLMVRRHRLLADRARPPEQRLLALYWVVVVAATTVAFVTSTAPVDTTSIRYLSMIWPALISLPVIVWRRPALPWLAALAIGFALLGALQLERREIDRVANAANPTPAEVSGVERFVRMYGLDHGYGQYWTAASTTQLSDFQVRAYPVIRCNYVGPGLCANPYHTIDSWYRPRPGVRTFYLNEDAGVEPTTGPPPPRWGRPFAKAQFGDYQIYAYDYDLASVLAAGRRAPASPAAAPRARP
jgi:hypothetical protein